MKKFLLSLLSCGAFMGAFAQTYPVTFQVDMRFLSASANGIHVAGNMQAAAGFPGDWDPATTELTDANSDGIYDVTLNLPAGTYQYKFVNGNAWGSDESAPAACQAAGSTNREVTVSAAATLPAVAYGKCDPYPAGYLVKFQVDMTNQTVGANGVHVAGDFQSEAGFAGDWDPATTELTDPDGNHIYDGIFALTDTGNYQFKYVNGNAWGSDEGVPAACQMGGSNRGLHVVGGATEANLVCYASCDPCQTGPVDTLWVEFKVDMKNVLKKAGVLGTTNIAGGFQGWNASANPMDDADGDSVYTTFIKFAEGNIQYKFIHRPGNCDNWENGNNRDLTIAGNANDTMHLAVVCYGEQGPCSPLPALINVTFKVDMSNEFIGPGGVFVAGDFQSPCNWVKNAIPMTDANSDNVYEATIPVWAGRYGYKYFNGTDGNPASDVYAETTNFDNAGCGNADFGHNRKLETTGMTTDYTTVTYVYNNCTISTVGIAESLNQGKAVSVVPNPFNAETKISFANPNAISYNITIANVAGQVVKRISDVRSNEVIVTKNDLGAEGIYFLTISNAKGEVYTKKLVLQ